MKRSLRNLRLLPLCVLALSACAEESATSVSVRHDVVALPGAAALGRAIFFDENLSLQQNQSCASCHAPEYGFAGANPGVNHRGAVSPGSLRTRAGNRKPPTAAYATFAPNLHYDATDEVWIGGNFWDGRATGAALGSAAADQAIGPFLNTVEQALPDRICVLHRIATGKYAQLWKDVWGEDLRTLAWPAGLEKNCRAEAPIAYPTALEDAITRNYGRVGLAVAAFEASDEVNAFSSKYDAYLAGRAQLTPEEQEGLALFNGKAQCALCHPSEGERALFTDFTYDNIGAPVNPLNPSGNTTPDLGLGGFLASIGIGNASDFDGAMKVPTLRNVDRAPGNAPRSFLHNGVFKSLEQVVHFYNTRDVLPRCTSAQLPTTAAGLAKVGFSPACWPAPEVDRNVNADELGNLGLTPAEERAVVAFLRTLSDGYR